MKLKTVIGILVASALGLTAVASYAGQGQGGGGAGAGAADHAQQADRDRTYDRDRIADRDRMKDRTHADDPDMKRDQDRDQDRIHMQDPSKMKNEEIYGNALMSDAEREQYRYQLGEAKTLQAQKEFQARHEETMRQRAREQNKDLVPPGQGKIYGGELMSVQERNEYREQLRLMQSDEERQQLQAQHRELMQQRAHELNLEIEEAE